MTNGGDRGRKARQHFEPGCARDHFVLDSGTREQEIHDHVRFGTFQADARKALHVFLLKDFNGLVAVRVPG
jgi:hypothetical protein